MTSAESSGRPSIDINVRPFAQQGKPISEYYEDAVLHDLAAEYSYTEYLDPRAAATSQLLFDIVEETPQEDKLWTRPCQPARLPLHSPLPPFTPTSLLIILRRTWLLHCTSAQPFDIPQSPRTSFQLASRQKRFFPILYDVDSYSCIL